MAPRLLGTNSDQVHANHYSTTNKGTTILSGIQPTGVPHLGNYYGALDNWVKLQRTRRNTTIFYSIVDLHALTIPQDPKVLRQSKRDMAIALMACGVDVKQSVLFEQSRVPQHAELCWILNCITPVGWLSRMTQWKSKISSSNRDAAKHSDAITIAASTEGLRMGLFAYPVLQAADILIYQADEVPIGEDQVQHLELAREIASTFNKTVGEEIFPLPKSIIPQSTKRIMSLREPTSKMSKSDDNDMSRINLSDTPEQIKAKIARATTDSERSISYDPSSRPGVSNLLAIYAACKNILVEDAVKSFTNVSGHKQFKEDLADAIIQVLGPIQSEMNRLHNESGYVDSVLEKGAVKARNRAAETLDRVYHAVGLR
ncbi:hypothetical protein BZG36_00280 [Bifiguratus adelaidae]|uniref:Tryptophan--tRNA ligase, mitochondrial n=1 Tax=Bifiguratus adelaidae TaxID=1938954 RepID=A0A261Y832_9FUNG|nr:hypothetical protein BZG36_00280 [Bifiguratus adelaidae]